MDKIDFLISQDSALIDQAIELHNQVFNETKATQYNDKSEWVRKINSGGYFVACTHDSQVVGYSVCDTTEKGEFKIWLAGVDPRFRQHGIWSDMYKNIKTFALNQNHDYVLLNTKPDQFPAMWRFLQKSDAKVYKKEMTTDGEKYFAKIYIP
ncbi:MAG: ribosomal protein S18 acetylase RimI-like enzyme [Candidatus Paceibacteria bacterium]|jgi:ribosomal protein S18 acetylase RimI-like enzyme